jgi:RimJ/RimL family protein N-acetyltransferase
MLSEDVLGSGSQNQHMAQPTLYTQRLQLVPLTDAHLELEIALDSDPEVMRYLSGRALSRAEVERAHRRRVAAAREVPGLGCWVGFAGGGFVGWWVLQPPHGPDQPEVAGEADLGYRLLRRHWRRGYASEGARELIRYGFGDLGLDRIFAQTNGGQCRVPGDHECSRAHLRPAVCFRRPLRRSGSGAEQGEVEYQITRSMWQHNIDDSSAGSSR